MPKPRPTKRQKKESDDESSSSSSSSSSSDSGPDDVCIMFDYLSAVVKLKDFNIIFQRYPPPKKGKPSNTPSKTASKMTMKDTDSKAEPMKNENGDYFWELDRNRRVTVRTFKGKVS